MTDHTCQTFEEASAVSAESILEGLSTDGTEDDIPMIRLSSTEEFRNETIDIAHAQIRHDEDHLPLPVTAIAVAELVTTSVRDSDIESGLFSARVYFNRAEFVSATFFKPDVFTSLGFNLHGRVPRIASIKDSSLASSSPLRVGDKIYSINKKHCSSMNSAAVSKLLQTLAGPVQIVVHNKGGSPNIVESMVAKDFKGDRSGLSLKNNGSGKLVVANVREDKAFIYSLLNIGDEILSINGIACDHLSAAEAANIIIETPKNVTVVARTPRETGVVVAELSTQDMRSNSSTTLQGTKSNPRGDSSGKVPKISTCKKSICAAMGLLLIIVIAAIVIVNSGRETDDYVYGDNQWDENNNTQTSISALHRGCYQC